jgi:hypothetical protein
MQQSKKTPKVMKTTFGVYFSSITRTIAVFYLNLQKIALKLLALIAPRKEQ